MTATPYQDAYYAMLAGKAAPAAPPADTITTAAELDALPHHTIVLDALGMGWQKPQDPDEGFWPSARLLTRGPLTVLYRPDRPVPGVLPSVEDVARIIAMNSGPLGTHYLDHAQNAARAVLALFTKASR